MKIEAMQKVIISGTKSYPIFITFIEAKTILDIATVPNFSTLDTEETLANNIRTKPVRKWQRPLIETKRENLTSHFNNIGEFMPNPVLLSQNPYLKGRHITVKPKITAGQVSSLWEIDIPQKQHENDYQLWIIDGQHRINGLGHADCKQNTNPIPVVLLLNTDTIAYSPTDFAKIFAQVTTTATSLNILHKEWLEYSFELGEYHKTSRRDAMDCVVEMCASPNFTEGTTTYSNPFHDQIIFNDEHKNDHLFLNCKIFSELIFQSYYEKGAAFSHLPPKELAVLIEKAYFQLEKNISNPGDSVFFATVDPTKKHIIVTKAFLRGVLSYILNHVNPASAASIPKIRDWKNLFDTLNFHLTNWDWSSHVSGGEGWYTKSERIANVLFEEAFISKIIPDGNIDMESCVQGNNRFIEITLTDISGKTIQRKIVVRKSNLSYPGLITNILISDKSFNCELISVVDKKTTSNFPVYFKMDYARKPLGKGIDVPFSKPATAKRPVVYNSTRKFTLEVKIDLYGGLVEIMEMEFTI